MAWETGSLELVAIVHLSSESPLVGLSATTKSICEKVKYLQLTLANRDDEVRT